MKKIVHIIKELKATSKLLLILAAIALFWFIIAIPKKLFDDPTSFVLEDSEGTVLSAGIASDGQWRFPYNGQIPDKFVKCITAFEDKRFFYHPGIDPVAFCRAFYQNIKSKKVISGGSTLTMQVIRLSRRGERTIWQKLYESVLALRLECGYSKMEILALYASNAPFGSNVVGLEAASWRYFGRTPERLSWGETAALAVLPNSPALVHPGKNQQVLMRKRNRLIDRLVAIKVIDSTTGALAKMEALPGQPLPLPQLAPHLLERFKKEYERQSKEEPELTTKITVTVKTDLQQRVMQMVDLYHGNLRGNGINNVAALVLDVETGNVLAYIGNVWDRDNPEMESDVDVLSSPRSPGSTLKPLLFAAMQHDGLLLPKQLIPDIPTQIGGYTPRNYNLEYDGAVPAANALSRSLNIPAVRMLRQYKYQRFYDLLKKCGFTTLQQPADFYGLSLILGGCEVTPWELAGVYSSLARTYLHQWKDHGEMKSSDWHMPVYYKTGYQKLQTVGSNLEGQHRTTINKTIQHYNQSPLPFDYTSIWHTFNAMQEVMRPGEEGLWNLFNSAQRIAWKTGTSFGFRDGWAIGLTPKFCVVVWTGNADGEGRPELTGINTAAPVMFDIFRLLPTSSWFPPPGYDFTYLPVCHQSGFRAGPTCTDSDTVLVSIKGANSPLCPFHLIVHLDHTASFRASENCQSPSSMVNKSWFILPPTMEYYYKAKHLDYLTLPPFLPGCVESAGRQLDIIYPEEYARIYVPLELTGQKGKMIFTAAHRDPDARLFWHLDNEFVGTTQRFHKLALNPSKGNHVITVVDEQGESVSRRFEILEKEVE
jgi:penicillin-binding protein 1C